MRQRDHVRQRHQCMREGSSMAKGAGAACGAADDETAKQCVACRDGTRKETMQNHPKKMLDGKGDVDVKSG